MERFQAIVATEDDGKSTCALRTLTPAELPDEDVLVRVAHSGLNYKDALAICGNRNRIMRSFPFVPGIDLAGTVVESRSPSFAPGDRVLATGWGIGERHWGGLAGMARMNPAWLTRMPDGMTSRQAMAVGTAGLTAWLCVQALQEGGARPGQGEVLVTGATGGVGSLAVRLLAGLGHTVVALTGKADQRDYLIGLGAAAVAMRDEFDREPKPLEKERWAGVVDTAGGRILAAALAQTRYGGAVAACGLASDFRLATTVMPFILRGVRLQGIDSVMLPAHLREGHWARLGELLPESAMEGLIHDIGLASVAETAERMVRGEISGRYVIDLSRK